MINLEWKNKFDVFQIFLWPNMVFGILWSSIQIGVIFEFFVINLDGKIIFDVFHISKFNFFLKFYDQVYKLELFFNFL